MFTLVQPYKMSSLSSRKIAEALGIKRIFVTKDTYVPKDSHVVINWGSHKFYPHVSYVNHPGAVQVAANKLHTFKVFKDKGISTVPWTESKEQAIKWVKDGYIVFCRTLLNASEGKGIKIALPNEVDKVVDSPLYTRYTKKKREFRVHVCDGKAIDVQQKRKRKEFAGQTSPIIRSYRFGWVFCRQNVEEVPGLRELAVKAVESLGLDFGAVDIIWNEHEGRCYVLEVNTAPGIEGSSIELYATALKAYLQKLENAKTTKTSKSLKTSFVV